MEDRFLTLELMAKVSDSLEEAGFKHVVARHHIDPEWRKQYGHGRPGVVDDISWTVSITDYLLPMDKVKRLIEICEANGLVVWWGATGSCDGEGRELYLKIATNESTAVRYGVPGGEI